MSHRNNFHFHFGVYSVLLYDIVCVTGSCMNTRTYESLPVWLWLKINVLRICETLSALLTFHFVLSVHLCVCVCVCVCVVYICMNLCAHMNYTQIGTGDYVPKNCSDKTVSRHGENVTELILYANSTNIRTVQRTHTCSDETHTRTLSHTLVHSLTLSHTGPDWSV